MTHDPRIIVAIDRPDADSAMTLVRQFSPGQCRLKVGKELFTAAGPALVEQFQALGFEVFLDLKFHDIPNTVQAACRVASSLGVWMLNVHAAGGRAMMEAAREGVQQGGGSSLLIAVTLLTSMDQQALTELGLGGTPRDWVERWGRLAVVDCSLDGLVCSAREVAWLRKQLGQETCLVTPGIRPAEQAGKDDQKRVMTPAQAMAEGSSYLVIGRPITAAADPGLALEHIHADLAACH